MTSDVAELTGRLWREVLQVPEVVATDDFFALGGHSMLATRFTSRLRKELGTGVSVNLIFDHPVFADFVSRLKEAIAAQSAVNEPVIAGRLTGPVSAQQEELLRMELALGPSPLNNIVVAVRTPAPLDAGLLRRA